MHESLLLVSLRYSLLPNGYRSVNEPHCEFKVDPTNHSTTKSQPFLLSYKSEGIKIEREKERKGPTINSLLHFEIKYEFLSVNAGKLFNE